MYIELDGDDVAVTYIKDIVFNANRQDVEVLRMVKVLSQIFLFFCATICEKFAWILNFRTNPIEKILSEH